jgi:hypothetical protein
MQRSVLEHNWCIKISIFNLLHCIFLIWSCHNYLDASLLCPKKLGQGLNLIGHAVKIYLMMSHYNNNCERFAFTCCCVNAIVLNLFLFLFYRFGAKNLGLSKLVPHLVKLLEDQSIPVCCLFVFLTVRIMSTFSVRIRWRVQNSTSDSLGCVMIYLEHCKMIYHNALAVLTVHDEHVFESANAERFNEIGIHLCLIFQVRDEAVNLIVEIYRHVGEKVRTDIAKRDINSSK